MALAIIGTPYEKANSNSIAAFNFGTGSDRVAVVVSVGVDGGSQDTTAVSIGGTPMLTSAALRQLDPDGWTYTRIFYLFNPPTGSRAITVTSSDNASTSFFLIAYSGVDTSGIGNSNKASGNSNHPAVAVTATAANNVIIVGVSNGTDSTAVSGNDGSTLVNEIAIAGSNGRAGMLRESTIVAGSMTVGATTANDFWTIVGLEIKAALASADTVSDDFNRTNSATMGSNWANELGTFGIDTNQGECTAVSSSIAYASYNTLLTSDDLTISADVICRSASSTGLAARYTSPDDTYVAYISTFRQEVVLAKKVGGSYSEMDTFNGGYSNDTTYALEMEIVGTTLNVYVDGVLRLTATDTDFSSGKVGVYADGVGNNFDNWIATIAGATSIKTIVGLAKASVKTINGLAIASVKTVNGLD